MSNLLSRLLLTLAAIISLAGCATQTALPPTQNVSQLHQLEVLNNWHIKGKLGLRTPSDSGSLYFNWKQKADSFDIQLSGALGQGTTRIYGDQQTVTLEQGSQPKVTAATAEQLLYDNTGWRIPVSQMHYWIRGIPTPNSPILSSEHNEQGRLQSLQQDGWSIDYTRHSAVNGLV